MQVSLLFRYNSLTLLLEDGTTTVEYVHIRAGSSRVVVGERVVPGQVLCESGQAGFCPTPHLHIEAHREGLRR
jgi:murein DD-endopeptidase MepM/ murein hydrolase activator NlpD